MGVLCSEDTKNQNKKIKTGNITETNQPEYYDNTKSLPSKYEIYNTGKDKYDNLKDESNLNNKKHKETKDKKVKNKKRKVQATDNHEQSDILIENDNEIGKNINIDSNVKVNYPNIDDNIEQKSNNNNIYEENKQDGKDVNSKNVNNNYYLKGNANDVNHNIIINWIDTNKEDISKTNTKINNEFQYKPQIKQDQKEEITRRKYQIPDYPRDYKQIMAEKNENNNENFYDMILDFNSFEQLKVEGWNAIFTESGKQKFDKSTKENNIIIGVVGNKNRGKSFLLGRIMKMKEY